MVALNPEDVENFISSFVLTLVYVILIIKVIIMEFITQLSEKEYRSFWEKSNLNHFMQSYEWGQICQKNRQQIPYYVGLKDKNQIVAAALLLKKETPLKMCYFYAPRGFTLDFGNQQLLRKFTAELKTFLKKENAIYLKIDPPIEYQTIDENALPIKGEKNNYLIFNNLLKLGYRHQGFNKLYEGNQPRYTFRTYYNQYQNWDDVEATISKTYLRQIKRSYNYDVEIFLADEVKTFHDLIKIISAKDGFGEYGYEYYNNVYQVFKKNGYIKIFNARINIEEIITNFKTLLTTEKNIDRQAKLTKDIAYFEELLSQGYQAKLVVASLICTYSKKGAWSLYIGNNEIAEYTGIINRLYYEFMKDAYENKYDYIDLFGTIGDPQTKYMNLAGLHEYKRKLGGRYIEFIGEFDLVNKKVWYRILPLLLYVYRKLKKIKKR